MFLPEEESNKGETYRRVSALSTYVLILSGPKMTTLLFATLGHVRKETEEKEQLCSTPGSSELVMDGVVHPGGSCGLGLPWNLGHFSPCGAGTLPRVAALRRHCVLPHGLQAGGGPASCPSAPFFRRLLLTTCLVSHLALHSTFHCQDGNPCSGALRLVTCDVTRVAAWGHTPVEDAETR